MVGADLSPLACQGRVGEGVARGRPPDATGAQQPHAAGGEPAGGHLELPLASPRQTSAHRACCGERVGAVRPTRAGKGEGEGRG